MHPQEESPLGLPLLLGSQLAPGSRKTGHKSPLTGDNWAQCPRHQPLPRASFPRPSSGDTGGGGYPALKEHHPHHTEMAPTGTGTECTASCIHKSQVRLPNSVLTSGVQVSKRKWGTLLCPPCQGTFCASVSLPTIDPQAQGVILQPRL